MNKLTSLLNKITSFRYYDLLFSLFLSVIGICMIVFPSTVIHIISVLCGVLLCAFALHRFLLLFTARARSVYFLVLFLINLFTLLCALALIFFSRTAVEIIGFFVGLVLIVDVLKRLYLILALREDGRGVPLLPTVICALTLLFGIFLLFVPSAAAGLTSILLGVALIVEGVQNAIFFFAEQKEKKSTKDDYIETDFQDKT